jgi:tripartite motif-containing protein 71
MFQTLLLLALLAFELGEYSLSLPREYEFAGEWSRTRISERGVCAPEGIAVGPNLNVYVASTYDDRILCFTSKGTYLRGWGITGERPGEFRRPTGVAVSPEGIVYVVDSWNRRVQYFTSKGKFLGSWGSEGRGPGEFDWPCSIAVGPSYNVYVSDRGAREIQCFTPTGYYVTRWSVERWDPEPMRDYLNVDVGPDGTVYVYGLNRSGCQRFTGSGDFLGDFDSYGSGLSSSGARGMITFAPNGVACAFGDRGFRTFDASGSLIGVWRARDMPIGEQTGFFKAWAVAPDGNVYFTDFLNSKIRSFTPTGRHVFPWPPRWVWLLSVSFTAVVVLVFILLLIMYGRKAKAKRAR